MSDVSRVSGIIDQQANTSALKSSAALGNKLRKKITNHKNMSGSRIAELSTLIATHTAAIDLSLAQRGLPSPSFQLGQPADLLSDETVASSRQIFLEATDELHALMLVPVGILTTPSVRCGYCEPQGSNKESALTIVLGLTHPCREA